MKKITELNQKEIVIVGGGVNIYVLAKIAIGPVVSFVAGSIVSYSILSDQRMSILIRMPLAAMTNGLWAAAGMLIGLGVAYAEDIELGF